MRDEAAGADVLRDLDAGPLTTVQAAGTMLDSILAILAAIDRHGDLEMGHEVLRRFGFVKARIHGRRAFQMAVAVARVRHARALKDREECARIRAFLKTLEEEEGSNV